MEKEYAYSLDGENYYGVDSTNIPDIIKEIMDDLKEYFEEDGFAIINIGIKENYKDKGRDCYATILDYFYERAYEEGGEWAENYLDYNYIPIEAREYLEKELDKVWEKFKELAKEESPFFRIYSYDTYKIHPNGDYEKFNIKNKC